MPGDSSSLAQRQAEIVQDVQAWSDANHIIVCPTYYSFDPVLERFFGNRPDDYWEDLGRLLPPQNQPRNYRDPACCRAVVVWSKPSRGGDSKGVHHNTVREL